MTTTFQIAKLSEVTACPACGEKVHDFDGKSIEFYCGSLIDHHPRNDEEGEASLQVQCDD